MKRKLKTIVLSLTLILFGGTFFNACNQDSLDLGPPIEYQSVDDYATALFENVVDMNDDILLRNRQIFAMPNRFSEELSLLSRIADFKDLEDLVNDTPFDFDLSKVNARERLLQEVAEAMSKQVFDETQLIESLERYSQNQVWSNVKRSNLRGDRMSCLRSYDQTTYKILLGEASCIAASVIKDGGASSPICAVTALSALVGANITLSNCLDQAER